MTESRKSIYLTQYCKRELARKVVQCLCEKEFMATVNNGTTQVLDATSHSDYLFDNLFTSTMDMLLVQPIQEDQIDGYGWVKLQYDAGLDIIVDHSPNLADVLRPAFDMAHVFHLAMDKPCACAFEQTLVHDQETGYQPMFLEGADVQTKEGFGVWI